jgi:hypothetical protein
MKLCGFEIGLEKPFFLIAGPCVIESRQMAFDTAGNCWRSHPPSGSRLSIKVLSTRLTVVRARRIEVQEWTKACRFWPMSAQA